MSRTMLAALSLAALIATACGEDGDSAPAAQAVSPDEAARLLIDRNWMTSWPTSETERLNVYRFTPSMGGGVFQDRTLFRGTFELFTYQIDGEHLTIQWPHSKQEDRMVFRIDRVKGPAPFDLRLELSGTSRGPRTYYGRSEETASPGGAGPAFLAP
ncbi:MAG TPA: hypothetical protein VKZ63_02440 [Kofleriaceae bacterium]|nr:hypothetical protein [Kofleriaceae bacterium]